MEDLFWAVLALALVAALAIALRNNVSLRFRLRSSGVKHGKTLEQLAPLSKDYPYDPRGFRFIGDPIDGVQFNDDSIAFVEFKSGQARLSERQKRIMENIERKRVEFREIRTG